MHMIFSYGGRLVEAVLLSATPTRLRVISPDWCDALDLHYHNAAWETEYGEAVEIESLVAEGPFVPRWTVRHPNAA
jgi:hypothetical protein